MIKLVLGNVGSGKTAQTVRWMKQNPHLTIITNIDTKLKHVIKLKPEMIIKKEVIGQKRDGSDITKLRLNEEFWKDFRKNNDNINVVIDEAHTFFNPRRSMNKVNIIMSDFLALLRRIAGNTGAREGKLILITQLLRRLDVIGRDMATDVEYCLNHYLMYCGNCDYIWREHNEVPNKPESCPMCGSHRLKKRDDKIEVWAFKDHDLYKSWSETGAKTFYSHYIIHDIKDVFGIYDTLQWDEMLSNYN